MDFAELPQNLPIPVDDGACAHLLHQFLPSVYLPSTQGRSIDLSKLSRVVIYCYPMTGNPNTPLPNSWDQIPGARGCTPQSCAFRDHYQELVSLGAQVYGLSTQNTEYQIEAAKRLHLPFELLSDSALGLAKSLKLPIFEIENQQLIKRVTLIAEAGKIVQVFYPVFPPDQNANQVVEWLQTNVSSADLQGLN